MARAPKVDPDRPQLPDGTSEWTLWAVAAACALHALEEYFTGWQAWAKDSLGITAPTWAFVVANVVLVGVAILFARQGWRRPTGSLVIPTATLVNAICFHIAPTIAQRHVAPGLYTAVALYLPFSTWALVGAARDGVPRRSIMLALVLGTIVALGIVWLARQYGGALT